MKKIIMVLMIVAFVATLAAGCGGASAPTTPSERKTVNGITNEWTKLEDDTSLMVTNVDIDPDYDSNTGVNPGKKVIAVMIKVKNEGNLIKIYKKSDFILKDSEGAMYQDDQGIKTLSFYTEDVKPGETAEGRIGFVVPKAETKFTFIYQGALGNIAIDLSKGE
ncbi:MAG: DUF4352 domain-containing protein [Caldisericaceae bacterium]|nr:DUF4352 domain-containing protein [Caldisericaceae bacterium]